MREMQSSKLVDKWISCSYGGKWVIGFGNGGLPIHLGEIQRNPGLA